MRRFLVLLLTVLCTLAGLAATARASAYSNAGEATVHSLVNATRAQKGLAALVRNDKLVAMARGQSDRMAARGDIYHNPRLGPEITASGLDWQRVGENVGMGPDVKVIEQAFLDSPHHYDNIVDGRYDSMGIGVVKGGNGQMYVTQMFADLRSAAPKAVAAAKVPAPATKPAPVPPTARPTQAAPQQAAPQHAPEPAPGPATLDPNVLTGGFVNEIALSSPGVVDELLDWVLPPVLTHFRNISKGL